MTAVDFENLCRHASRQLRLDDIEAMGRQAPFELAAVTLEVLHEETAPGLLVLAELGRVQAQEPARVYEQLLSLQYLLCHQPGIRFGYRDGDRSVVLMLGVPRRENLDGEWLATALRGMAEQVGHWRDTLLSQAFSWDAPASAPAAQGLQGRFDARMA